MSQGNGIDECVVVGGGLAGAGAALLLARAGRRVRLLERTTGPHDKVCGEFLSAEALHYLQSWGLDVDALGAIPLRRVRFAAASHVSERVLPFAVRSITRCRLDEALLQAAARAGATVDRGVHVAGIDRSGTDWVVSARDGVSLRARDVFLATGKHDLRARPRPAGGHPGLVGFKTYFRLSPANTAELDDAVELVLFPGGYAGLQRVQDDRANLSLLVQAELLRNDGLDWPALLRHMAHHAPHLRARLAGAVPLLDKPLTVSAIPYGHLQATALPGLWHLGDQAAVIPSFSGDGMSIALHTAALAAQMYFAGGSSAQYLSAVRRQLTPRLKLATALSRTLVHRPALARIVQIFPSLLTGVASATRIPQRHLVPAPQTPLTFAT